MKVNEINSSLEVYSRAAASSRISSATHGEGTQIPMRITMKWKSAEP